MLAYFWTHLTQRMQECATNVNKKRSQKRYLMFVFQAL